GERGATDDPADGRPRGPRRRSERLRQLRHRGERTRGAVIAFDARRAFPVDRSLSAPAHTATLNALRWADADRVLHARGLGPLRSLTPLSGGWINPVFLLNGEFVLRIRPAGKSGGAFQTEAMLCRRLRGKAPVPEILAVDTSREVLDAD